MLKKWMMIASILILIGVVGSIFTFKTVNKTVVVNEQETIDYRDIKTIEINSVSTDVELIHTTDLENNIAELKGTSSNGNTPKLKVIINTNENKIIFDIDEKNGKWLSFNPISAASDMKLKLFIPEELVGDLKFDSVSGNLFVENVKMDKLKVDTTSGDIQANNMQFANSEIDTVSGNVNFDQVSGNMKFDTVSGKLNLKMKKLMDELKISTISGDVNVQLEEDPSNVEFHIEKISGNVNLFGKYKGNTSLGDGSSSVYVDTVSGDVIFK